MRTHIGDRIVVGDRTGVVVATAGGRPPYRVRWRDSGYVTLLLPGPYARIETGIGRPSRGAEQGEDRRRQDEGAEADEGDRRETAQVVLP